MHVEQLPNKNASNNFKKIFRLFKLLRFEKNVDDYLLKIHPLASPLEIITSVVWQNFNR